ncbi:glycerophosphodiester phosphodiesterase family protein [Dermabacteraceae bacterium P13136]
MTANTRDFPRFFTPHRPRLIAHRGFSPAGYENTLTAFADALAAGADLLETDCRASADGIAFTTHDATLLRLAGDPRQVSALNSRQVADIDLGAGHRIPTLREALTAFPDSPFNIDVKDAHAALPVAHAIAAADAAERVCLTGFSAAPARIAAQAVQRLTGKRVVRAPSLTTVAALRAALAARAPRSVMARLLAPYQALQIPEIYGPIRVVTPRLLAAAHALGLEVHVWTVDERSDMERLLEMGVDGIVTNRADLLSGVLAATGRRDI